MLQLLQFEGREKVEKIVQRLECKDADYLVLQAYLQDSVAHTDTVKKNIIVQAMNYRKYISLLQESEYILVNLAAADAKFYRNNIFILDMKSVVGKQVTPTPTIASYISAIITFPFWSVPQSIARKEMLPKAQKDSNYLRTNNLEIVDAQCNNVIITDSLLQSYTERNFPYYFRQSSGSDNAMGVLKFELENPFSIFLHATNSQNVFELENRFLSHGCIRLEKPLGIAKALLGDKIDINSLQNGKKDTKSELLILPKRLQTFIIYMPLQVVKGNVFFLYDVYRKF